MDRIQVKLLDILKKEVRLAKFWGYVALGAGPEIYTALGALGVIGELPETLKWTLRVLAAAGIAYPILKQKYAKEKKNA